ncbi:MAG: hypothetical protein QOE90_1530 [Thermoplasmata archaeon]|jgi:hypothetical protein|nr:hypothetical protein [Thermoplasmata archaeon]
MNPKTLVIILGLLVLSTLLPTSTATCCSLPPAPTITGYLASGNVVHLVLNFTDADPTCTVVPSFHIERSTDNLTWTSLDNPGFTYPNHNAYWTPPGDHAVETVPDNETDRTYYYRATESCIDTAYFEWWDGTDESDTIAVLIAATHPPTIPEAPQNFAIFDVSPAARDVALTWSQEDGLTYYLDKGSGYQPATPLSAFYTNCGTDTFSLKAVGTDGGESSPATIPQPSCEGPYAHGYGRAPNVTYVLAYRDGDVIRINWTVETPSNEWCCWEITGSRNATGFTWNDWSTWDFVPDYYNCSTDARLCDATTRNYTIPLTDVPVQEGETWHFRVISYDQLVEVSCDVAWKNDTNGWDCYGDPPIGGATSGGPRVPAADALASGVISNASLGFDLIILLALVCAALCAIGIELCK